MWVGKESSQARGRASHGSWDNSRLGKRNGSGHTEVIHEWGTEGFVVHVLEENWEGAIKVIGSPGKGSGLVVSTSADTGCRVLSGFGSGPDVLCGLGFDRA